MDYKLRGPLSYCALVLMLLEVQWRPVFSVPLQSCDENLETTTRITNQLNLEVKILLDAYVKFHDINESSVLDDVPTPTISGITISERLQDIYIKTELFHMHISQVEEFQKPWGKLTPDDHLSLVKDRLHYLLHSVKKLLRNIDPNIPLPTAKPIPSRKDDFAKKNHGLRVILNLKDWVPPVVELLTAEDICGKETV